MLGVTMSAPIASVPLLPLSFTCFEISSLQILIVTRKGLEGISDESVHEIYRQQSEESEVQ